MQNLNKIISAMSLVCLSAGPVFAGASGLAPIKGTWKSSYGSFIITDKYTVITEDDGKTVAYMCFVQTVQVKDYYEIQCHVPADEKKAAAQAELRKQGVEYDVARKPYGGKIEIGHADFVIYLRDKPEIAYER